MIDPDIFHRYTDTFPHTITTHNIYGLPEDMQEWIEDQMSLALHHKRPPLTDVEIFGEVPKGALT